jgi:hypothetical protein
MADLDDLGYKSIIDMQTDEAIDTLRQIRLSRRVPEKPRKQAKETIKQTTKKVAAAISSDAAAELLKLLGGDK